MERRMLLISWLSISVHHSVWVTVQFTFLPHSWFCPLLPLLLQASILSLFVTILAMSIHMVFCVKKGSTSAKKRFCTSLVHDGNMCPESCCVSINPLTLRTRSWFMKCKLTLMSASTSSLCKDKYREMVGTVWRNNSTYACMCACAHAHLFIWKIIRTLKSSVSSFLLMTVIKGLLQLDKRNCNADSLKMYKQILETLFCDRSNKHGIWTIYSC